MSVLSEIIDQLYEQSQQSASLANHTGAVEDAATDRHLVDRLWRVLTEMADVLTTDEQPEGDDVAPSPEVCLRIMNHWDAMTQSEEGIRSHMASLEADIARMQPWGDFDVMKVEALAHRGIRVRFWITPLSQLAQCLSHPQLAEHCPQVISQDASRAYLVTVSTEDSPLVMPTALATEADICPCPISTLIMLQTRDKDSLKQVENLRGDYALAHFSEVYAALRQLLPPDADMPELRRNLPTLRQRLHRLFAKL